MGWQWKVALKRSFDYPIRFLGLWDKELEPPPTFFNRRPLYMRNILNRGELLMISAPSTDSSPLPTIDRYGFHHIRFDSTTGFRWVDDFFDPEFAPPAYPVQVVMGHLAFVLVDDMSDPSRSGVRVYHTHCGTPEVGFVRLLHAGEDIVSMGKDPIYTTLVSNAGKIYLYENVNVNSDVALFHESDFLETFGLRVKRAHVFSHASMLVWGFRNGVSELWWITRQGGLSHFLHYGIPTAPAEDALGDRSATLEWYMGQSPPVGGTSYGLWGRIVVTGTDRWIRLYYYPGTGSEFFLVPFFNAASDPSMTDRWSFHDFRALDWDVKLREITDNEVKFDLIITRDTGKVFSHIVHLHLQPSGDHDRYFYLPQYIPGIWNVGDDVKSAFWADGWESGIPNPRFEVQGSGKVRFISAE